MTTEPLAGPAPARVTPTLAGTRLRALRDPVTLVILAATLAGLGLRAYYLSRPGFLLGVTEYDDGPYFGSAVRLTQGILPYRDFVLVQPPGITLIMTPVALAAKIAGTARGLAAARILTAAAGTASVPLLGQLVRHRGPLAALIACSFQAIFADSVAAAHTVLVEPWLVLFCLVGALLVFRGDSVAAGRRLLLGGVCFGFAGLVEAWAVVPVLVLLVVLLTDRPRRAVPFGAGVAAGFGVPVLPFAALAPRGFYQSLVVAQVGPRTGAVRVGLLSRLQDLTGLSDIRFPLHVLPGLALGPAPAIWGIALVAMLIAVGGPVLVNLTTGKAPAPLEWFALGSTELIVVMFLWPSQFHYHFAAFLCPFLALALALPVARLERRTAALRRPVAVLTAGLAVLFAVIGLRTESQLQPVVGPSAIAAVQRIIPPGTCVVSDDSTLLLLASRFVSGVPGCGVIDDGLGTDLALSAGRTPATGAASVPAVARLWQQAFDHATFAWFSAHSWRRIAWSPSLLTYFRRDFRPILTDRYGDTLYRRIH
jgi:alpha-1,2-mannosyltransferase